MKKNKYLITGGLGFIGSNLIRKLSLMQDVSIYNIDKVSYSSSKEALKDIKLNDYKFKKLNIVNRNKISDVINSFKPDYIIHLAAESHVDRSIDNPDDFIKSNVVGTFNLLSESHKYWKNLRLNLKNKFRFIHVSTDEVYGSLLKNELPFTEDNSYYPNSPYSASKASSDHLARS